MITAHFVNTKEVNLNPCKETYEPFVIIVHNKNERRLGFELWQKYEIIIYIFKVDN